MLHHIIILLLIVRLVPLYASSVRICKDETKVNHVCKLQEDYDLAKVPQFNKTTALTLTPIKIEIFDITDLNEEKQTITVNMMIQMKWQDVGLSMSNGTKET